MSRKQVRVLIVDDSAVVRGLLVRALQGDSSILVAGTAMHGELALDLLRRQPADVVILDVEMPVMDGLTALPHILREFPDTRVIMASASTYAGAQATVQALALGAAGCIAKPSAGSVSASIERLVGELVPLIKALGRESDRNRSVDFAPRVSLQAHLRFDRPEAVVIGASTGGPNALSQVLAGLPPDFDCPILIVQHMPPAFTPMLARHLAQDGRRPCIEAVQGGPIESGHTYVAPGNFHLVIGKVGQKLVTTLNQDAPEHFCRPSVNPLFRSAAERFGNRLLAVMLTGMGSDGIEGARAVSARDGLIVAQDEATSVVWGMPGAVVREGLAHDVLPLGGIASAMLHLCTGEVLVR